jgi:PAS domain S-box-containing protein
MNPPKNGAPGGAAADGESLAGVQAALRELEQRSSALINAAPESIWMFSRDGVIQAVNATGAARIGRRVDELIGTKWADYMAADVAAGRAQKIAEVVRTKGPVSFEDERAGIVFDHSFFPVLDAAGEVVSVAVFSRDITARRLVDQRLRQSEALYRSIGESIDYGVWVCDPDGRNTYASESFLAMVGLTQEQCSSFGWGNVLHPDDAERTIARWQECVRTGGTWDIEHRFRGADGEWHDVLARGVPVRDERGAITCWAGINLDITRLKQTERRLRESEERFRSVLDSSLDVIYRLNLQTGRYEYISPSVETVLGYAPDEIEAMGAPTSLALIHPDDLPAVRAMLAHLEEAGEADMEYRQRAKSGEFRWLSNHASVCRDEAGRPLYRSGNIRDITERRRAEGQLRRTVEELARSNKELEQFAYVSSHDLQEPLRMVTAFTGLLRDRYRGKLDAKADEYIDFALEGATRMQSLIHDLLAYSRVGGRTADLAVTNVAEALQTALTDLDASLATAGALVTSDPLPAVVADGSQLAQVFENLIGNSIKYRREQVAPEIHVGAERRRREWVFFVRDNGIGIDPEYSGRIFEIFQRLHGRKEYPGTGVGLAICRKIVERHGGRIWVDSRSGEGATFFFTIPDAPSAPRPAVPDPSRDA